MKKELKYEDFLRFVDVIEDWLEIHKSEDIKTLGQKWMNWNYQNQNKIPYMLMGDRYNPKNKQWSFWSKKGTSKDFSMSLYLQENNNSAVIIIRDEKISSPIKNRLFYKTIPLTHKPKPEFEKNDIIKFKESFSLKSIYKNISEAFASSPKDYYSDVMENFIEIAKEKGKSESWAEKEFEKIYNKPGVSQDINSDYASKYSAEKSAEDLWKKYIDLKNIIFYNKKNLDDKIKKDILSVEITNKNIKVLFNLELNDFLIPLDLNYKNNYYSLERKDRRNNAIYGFYYRNNEA
jgi:hypothetical protein